MIDKRFNNLIDELQSVHMTKDEKAQLKNRVFLAIDKAEATLKVDSLAPVAPVSIKSISYGANAVRRSVSKSWYSYFAEKKFVPAFAVLLILVSTGGASIAAERALPGDFLYPLKININEEVQGLAAITPEAKAKFALEVTDRRLKEAAVLSSQGRLDSNTSTIISEQLLKQAGQVKNQVASLVSTNKLQSAQEVALNFESALKTHEFILQKLSADTGTSTGSDAASISSIIATVQTELATTTSSRADLQSKELERISSKNKTEVTNRLTDLLISIDEVKALAMSTPLTVAASSTIGLYITQANDLTAVATAKINAGEYPGALTEIQKASQYVSDAEAIIYAITIDPNADKSIGTVIQAALSSSSTLPISTVGSQITATSTAATGTSTADTASSTAATSTPDQK